jgi:hypothetical protein
MHLRILKDHEKHFKESEPYDFIYPPVEVPVFDAHLSKLGLLSERQLEIVLNIFLSLKVFDRSIELHAERNEPRHTIPSYKGISVIKIIERFIPDVEKAISELS